MVLRKALLSSAAVLAVGISGQALAQDTIGDTAATAGLLTVGGDGQFGAIETGGDRDWYSIQLNAGQPVTIEMLGDPSAEGTLPDPYLVLYDAGGAEVARNDDFYNLESLISFTPATTGTYYVSAQAFADYTGTYRLLAYAGESEPPEIETYDDYADFGAQLPLTAYVGGYTYGELEEAGDTDVFAAWFEQGDFIDLQLLGAPSGEGTLSDPYLEVYDDYGAWLFDNDDADGSFESRLRFRAFYTGVHYVVASAYGEQTGTYSLLMNYGDFPDDAGDDESSTASIAGGQTINGTVDFIEDEDWYRLTLNAGQTVTISLSSDNAAQTVLGDPYLFIIDPEGFDAAWDDDSAGDFNATTTFTAELSGTYYVVARAYSSGTGGYVLQVSPLSGGGGGGKG
ncbi:MAG: PPC domain-containing protein [Azospirillaceae bacterium]